MNAIAFYLRYTQVRDVPGSQCLDTEYSERRPLVYRDRVVPVIQLRILFGLENRHRAVVVTRHLYNVSCPVNLDGVETVIYWLPPMEPVVGGTFAEAEATAVAAGWYYGMPNMYTIPAGIPASPDSDDQVVHLS